MNASPNFRTKADLLECVTRIFPLPAALLDYRVRVLSEARLLPRRRERLTFGHLAYLFCGLFGSETHLEAVERAKRLHGMPLLNASGDGVLLPPKLCKQTYGEVLAALLYQSSFPNSPIEVRGLTISSTHDEAELLLGGQVIQDPASYVQETYTFGTLGKALASHVVTLKTRHEIAGSAFRAIASIGSEAPTLFGRTDSLPANSVSEQSASAGNEKGDAPTGASPQSFVADRSASDPRNEDGGALPGAPPLTHRSRERELTREIRTTTDPDHNLGVCGKQGSRASEAVNSDGVTPYVRKLEATVADLS